MIVSDFHVIGVPIPPFEADAPLVIDANAILTRAIAGQFFQAIRRRNAKVLERHGPIQHTQFPEGNLLYVQR